MNQYVFHAIVMAIVNLVIFAIAGLLEQRTDSIDNKGHAIRKEIHGFEEELFLHKLNNQERKRLKNLRRDLETIGREGDKANRQTVLAFICGVVALMVFLILVLVFLENVRYHAVIALLVAGLALGVNRIVARKWTINTTFCMAVVIIFAIFSYGLEKKEEIAKANEPPVVKITGSMEEYKARAEELRAKSKIIGDFDRLFIDFSQILEKNGYKFIGFEEDTPRGEATRNNVAGKWVVFSNGEATVRLLGNEEYLYWIMCEDAAHEITWVPQQIFQDQCSWDTRMNGQIFLTDDYVVGALLLFLNGE